MWTLKWQQNNWGKLLVVYGQRAKNKQLSIDPKVMDQKIMVTFDSMSVYRQLNQWVSQHVRSLQRLKCGATFAGRDWGAFRLDHLRTSAADIKILQSAKRVILQYLWEKMMRIGWMRDMMHMHVVDAWLGMTERGQLHILLVACRYCLLLGYREEVRWCVWYVVHPQVEWFSGTNCLPSCKLESLHLLLQCIIQSCDKST